MGRREAARLLGAAESIHERARIARPPPRRAEFLERRRTIAQALGRRAFATAWQQGMTIPTASTIEQALRGGSGRGRTDTGWEVLTPAERRVANLVVEGLTNSQIAERAFVTISTVEGHVSRIFSKLGLASRAQLVREGVRREMGGDA